MSPVDNAMKSTIESILHKIKCASQRRPPELANWPAPRLVAVGKTKPQEMIIQAYQCGLRHFGENYVEELLEKSTSPQILDACPEIRWHFIGHLQRGKVNKLLAVRNLHLMETIDSQKLADAIDQRLGKRSSSPTPGPVSDSLMNVLIQVNTSGEENKNGVPPDEVVPLVEHIKTNCPNLTFRGLMTIGALANSQQATTLTEGLNPDFQKLRQCHRKIVETFQLEPADVELSMGMSHDYEIAVEMGSSNVRVGSLIFGERNYKK